MAKSALLDLLRRAHKIAQLSLKSGIPTDEIHDMLSEKISRRRLLHGGLALASAIGAASLGNCRGGNCRFDGCLSLVWGWSSCRYH
jgi:monoamine oxidase